MALPQAPLGSMPSISLGGYIPAARNDPSVLEQALAAFLGGAAGTAGNRLVDKALPDPQRVAAQKLANDQLEAQKLYQAGQLKLGEEGNRLTQYNIDTSASSRASDRTSAEERAKADREAAEVENWRRSQALNSRYLGDNATELARTQAEAAARHEALIARAAAEERQDKLARDQLAAGDPVRRAQARHYDASSSALEADLARTTPQGQSAAAGQALGNIEGTSRPLEPGEERLVIPETTNWDNAKANMSTSLGHLKDWFSYVPREIFMGQRQGTGPRVQQAPTAPSQPNFDEQRAKLEEERLRNKMLLEQMRARGLADQNP